MLFTRSEQHTTTSAVDYLYPNATTEPMVQQGVPVLSLPMRVGLAFVPDNQRSPLTEAKKTELLEKVASHFKKLDYVKSIEIIPTSYLTPRGEFQNLDQIRALHGIETIALVSYDQKQVTDEGIASLVYWTVVGAYIVRGEKNSTHTMVDTVIMHIPSRKMLFRAPGISQVQGTATLINQSEQLRKDGEKGFQEAIDKMIPSLDQQLVAFQDRVKSSPEVYKVVNANGSPRGGGAFDLWSGAMLGLVLAGGAWWARRR